MSRTVFMILASLAMQASLAVSASAAELFHLEGKNSAGAAVNVAVTDEMAETIGVTEIRTKVVSLGDTVQPVRGIEVRKLLKAHDLAGDNLRIAALDGYVMDIPRSDIDAYPVLFAFEVGGKRLSVRDKGPAWIIYPVSDHKELDDPVFEARSVWQVKTATAEQK